jgi:transcriptional regulator with XRE-family HTH domain
MANFFKKNIVYLRKNKGFTQIELATALSLKRTTIANYESGHTEPNIETILSFSEFFGVDAGFLLKNNLEDVGLSQKLDVTKNAKNVGYNVGYDVGISGKKQDIIGDFKVTIVAEPEAEYGHRMQPIPVTDISVAAGGGIYNDGHYETGDAVHLPTRLVKPGHTYLCVKIKGVSMAPTLQDGGYVIIRLLDKSEWAKMPDERVFVVIDTDGKAYLKRVKNRFKQGFIVLRSDSPEQVTFPSFNLETKEITAIWYVEWYFTAKMPNVHDQFYSRLQQLEDRVDDMQVKQLKK